LRVSYSARILGRLPFIRRLKSPESQLTAMMLAYTGVFCLVSLMRFYTFRTYLDLGIFDQAFSSSLHGRLFYETPDLVFIPSGNFLGTHFAPILFFLLPIYAVFPAPQTLLVVQTVFIALGAIPVYLVAKELLKKQKIAVLLSGLYLLNPATQSLNLFDFHLEAFLPLFLGMFYCSLIKKKWKSYILFLGLSLITIEFAPIMVGAICLSFLIMNSGNVLSRITHLRDLFKPSNLSYTLPIITIPLAAASFYGQLFGGGFVAGTHSLPQEQLMGFFVGIGQWQTLGDKFVFWILVFGSLAFIPIRSGRSMVMIAPWIVVTAITSIHPFVELGYQYAGAFVTPYLLFCTAYAIRKLNTRLWLRRLLAISILASIMLSPLNPLMTSVVGGIAYEEGLPIPDAHDAIIYAAVSQVPSNASILVQNNFFAHFTNRPDAYLYTPDNNTRPEFILADASSRWYTQPIFNYFPICHFVKQGLVNGTYGLLMLNEGVVLLRRSIQGIAPSPAQMNVLYFTCPLDSKACGNNACRPSFLLTDQPHES